MHIGFYFKNIHFSNVQSLNMQVAILKSNKLIRVHMFIIIKVKLLKLFVIVNHYSLTIL